MNALLPLVTLMILSGQFDLGHQPDSEFQDDNTPACDINRPDVLRILSAEESFATISVINSVEYEVGDGVEDAGTYLNCDDTIKCIERNNDFATAGIVVDADKDVCGLLSEAYEGFIRTENLVPVSNVEVTITIDTSVQIVFTDQNGYYQFLANSSSPSDIIVSCRKNDDPRNGVSTLDLVKIQKHLLGLEVLNSPYKLIAADANNSLSVSAIDLVEIRKLILGLLTGFPNNNSWRFVPVTYEFDDPQYPWPFPETNEGINDYRFDFIGIKIGDVNNTYRGD